MKEDITELFCCIDDFYQEAKKQRQQYTLYIVWTKHLL